MSELEGQRDVDQGSWGGAGLELNKNMKQSRVDEV